MLRKLFYLLMGIPAFVLIALANASAASACIGVHYQPELPQHLRRY